ncbi:MAG TPA: PAS domain S-box protein [Anaerolineae bacterium]|nr:PAS domain S-box protein [Anaerolineae bacterium]
MNTKTHILIIDDNAKSRTSLADVLKSKGYLPIGVARGKTALNMIKNEIIAVALIDLDVPDIHGFQVINEIKKYSPGTECIILSTYISKESAIEAMKLGVFSYEQKPCDVDKLLMVVERALEKQKTGQALRVSEERYRTIVENVPALICSFLPDGTLTFVNDALCTYFNTRREELIGFNFFQCIPEKDYKKVKRHFSSLTQKKPIGTYEYNVLFPDGTVRYQQWTDRVLCDQKGHPTEYQSIGIDITERKKFEERLNQQIVAIEASMDGIAILDRNKRFLYLNKAHARIYGYESPDELIGKIWRVLHNKEETERIENEIVPEFLEKGQWRGEALGKKKDGTTFHQEFSLTAIKEGGMICIVRDITERKKAEKAIDYRLKLEKLIAAISTHFIRIIPEKIDSGISYALQKIGEFSCTDRGYVFLFKNDNTLVDNTHEWCAAGIEPQIDNLKNLPVETVPWWMNKLNRFESIHIPSVIDLPPEAGSEKEILQMQNTQSLIVVPLIKNNSLFGFMGFDSVRTKKTWKEEDITLLNMVGEILVNALERKRAEEELKNYSQKLEELVEERTKELNRALYDTEEARDRIDGILKSIGEGIIVTDVYNRVILMNRAAEDLLDVHLCDIINRPIECAIDDMILLDRLITTFSKDVNDTFDFKFYSASIKEPRYMRARTSVIREKTGRKTGVITIFYDVTREREIDRMKTEFISTVAHELRTPLTSIRGFSEILLTSDHIDPDKQKKYMKYINEQSVKLAHIISDMLDISNFESEKGL